MQKKTNRQLKHHEQVRCSIQQRVDGQPRGTRARLARATGHAPTVISSALNGALILPRVIERIEILLDEWAHGSEGME